MTAKGPSKNYGRPSWSKEWRSKDLGKSASPSPYKSKEKTSRSCWSQLFQNSGS